MRKLLISPALLLCGSIPGAAQRTSVDLARSTMEELTQIEVSISSVSRKEEILFHTPAAAYVLTREDIAHSTADSIPELLRSVPGLQVAQVSASTWAVSARGFNSAFANKLLVLIDGRTVYSELYAGEHWDEIDLPLEDVERIEIIRGPGAVVWGTNAVNGVVNIITRPARAVSGMAISGRVSRVNDQVLVQDGGILANGAQYREIFSFTDRRPLENADGSSAFGGEQLYRAGARVDWRKNNATSISVLGGAYGGPNHQLILSSLYPALANGGQEHDSTFGGYGLLRIEHSVAHNSYELQTYASSADRHELGAKANTITEDIDYVDHFRAAKRLDLVSGGELRLTQDFVNASVPVTRKPSYYNYLVDGFLQGDVSLLPNRLTATLGSKVQDGTLAGFQLQPSARLSWIVDPTQFVWAAVSRSAVAPALQDKQLTLGLFVGTSNGVPVGATITGNPAYKPETVLATEFGYRKHLPHDLSFDLAAYANDTRRLQSFWAGSPTFVSSPSPAITVPLFYINGFAAKSQGAEASLSWKPNGRLHLRGNYTWLEAQLTQTQAGMVDLTDGFNTARNTFAGLANWTFAPAWNVEGLLYKVGSINPNSTSAEGLVGLPDLSAAISGFTRLDVALEHQAGSRLKLSAGGTNLTSARHVEFGGFTNFLSPLYVPRSLFLRASWSF